MVTTFLTIRQSQKRGMMPAATPDNPMASSQKYMTYIMPFFALTGLYWPFGLVLYWVTTNVWTLGQQFILGRRYPYTPPAADDSKAPAGQERGRRSGGCLSPVAHGWPGQGRVACAAERREGGNRQGRGERGERERLGCERDAEATGQGPLGASA